jgi:mono/diheme cytochrome c family protein
MNRAVVLACVAVLGASATAVAQTSLERGRYLVDTVMTCHNCHTPRRPSGLQFDKALSGGLRFDEPAFDVTASNITPDRDTGIGSWTDTEIKTSLQEGTRSAGHRLAAVMPSGFYKILTPADLDGIVAYLRSVPPVDNKVRGAVYKKPTPNQVFPGAEKPMSEADFHDPIKRGFYLVTIAHRMECHTPFGPSGIGIDFKNSLGQGGREFRGPVGRIDLAQHHLEQGRRHGRLERCRGQACHRAGRAQGRYQAQASDGLCVLRQDDRWRPRCHGRLPAHGASEGVISSRSVAGAARYYFLRRGSLPITS